MKRIEDIEKMDFGMLEAVSNDMSIETPADLRESIESAIAKEGAKPGRWIRSIAVAASLAAVAAGGLALRRNAPLKDTYDDPYLAYAEVQKAFERISDSMSEGVSSLEKTKQYIDLPANILRK